MLPVLDYLLLCCVDFENKISIYLLLYHGKHIPEVGHYVSYNTNGLVYTQFILVLAKSRSRSSQITYS